MTTQSITKNFKEYSLINLILNKLKISYLKVNSDSIGALASGLCMIHCVATPFFFIASACTASCCNMAPGWWQAFDYFFLFVSIFAIYQTSKQTTSNWIILGLAISWLGILFFIVNANQQWFSLHGNFKFIPAFSLIGLHLYNLRYCQCKVENCC